MFLNLALKLALFQSIITYFYVCLVSISLWFLIKPIVTLILTFFEKKIFV